MTLMHHDAPNKKAEADKLYGCFSADVLKLGAQFRALFVLKSRGVMTMKLLCTGLLDSNTDNALLRGLDTLSLRYASMDSVPEQQQQDIAERLRQKSTVFYAFYESFCKSFRALVDCYRGRDVWYKTPPGLCTALYLAFRLKYCTAQCARFETHAVGLIETATSFREIRPWHRWISGLKTCVHCQWYPEENSGGGGDNKKTLQLCGVCDNAYYCSLQCKKKNAKVHRNYCRRAPSNATTTDLYISTTPGPI